MAARERDGAFVNYQHIDGHGKLVLFVNGRPRGPLRARRTPLAAGAPVPARARP